jgi:hypothetical protein
MICASPLVFVWLHFFLVNMLVELSILFRVKGVAKACAILL